MNKIIKRILGVLILLHIFPLICYFIPPEDSFGYGWYADGWIMNAVILGWISIMAFAVWLLGGFDV